MNQPTAKRRHLEEFDDEGFELTQDDLQQFDMICSQHVPPSNIHANGTKSGSDSLQSVGTSTNRPPLSRGPSSGTGSVFRRTLANGGGRHALTRTTSLDVDTQSQRLGIQSQTTTYNNANILSVINNNDTTVGGYHLDVAEADAKSKELSDQVIKLKEELFMKLGELETIKETHTKFSRSRMDEIRRLQTQQRRERDEAKKTIQSLQSQLAFREADYQQMTAELDRVKYQFTQQADMTFASQVAVPNVSQIPIQPSPMRARTRPAPIPRVTPTRSVERLMSAAVEAHERRWREEKDKTRVPNAVDENAFPTALTFMAPSLKKMHNKQTIAVAPTDGSPPLRKNPIPPTPPTPTPISRKKRVRSPDDQPMVSPTVSKGMNDASTNTELPGSQAKYLPNEQDDEEGTSNNFQPLTDTSCLEEQDTIFVDGSSNSQRLPWRLKSGRPGCTALQSAKSCQKLTIIAARQPSLRYLVSKLTLAEAPAAGKENQKASSLFSLMVMQSSGSTIMNESRQQSDSTSITNINSTTHLEPQSALSSSTIKANFLRGVTSLFSRVLGQDEQQCDPQMTFPSATANKHQSSSSRLDVDSWDSYWDPCRIELPEVGLLYPAIIDYFQTVCSDLNLRGQSYAVFQAHEPTISTRRTATASILRSTPSLADTFSISSSSSQFLDTSDLAASFLGSLSDTTTNSANTVSYLATNFVTPSNGLAAAANGSLPTRVNVFSLSEQYPRIDWEPPQLLDQGVWQSNVSLALASLRLARLLLTVSPVGCDWPPLLLLLTRLADLIVTGFLPYCHFLLETENRLLPAALAVLADLATTPRLNLPLIHIHHLLTVAVLSHSLLPSILRLMASLLSSPTFSAQLLTHGGRKVCIVFLLLNVISTISTNSNIEQKVCILKEIYSSLLDLGLPLVDWLIHQQTRTLPSSPPTQLPYHNHMDSNPICDFPRLVLLVPGPVNCLLRTLLALQSVHGYTLFQRCTDPLPAYFHLITGLTRLLDCEVCPPQLDKALVEEFYDFGSDEEKPDHENR